MRRLVRGVTMVLSGLLGLILLLVCVLAGTLWLTLPATNQTVHLPGLSAPVDIAFDHDGIPRIRAATETDAMMALGYVHARDRMFQMELMRRAMSGRLSELAGAVTLPLDRTTRVLGAHHRAAEDVETLPEDTRALLRAYAAGVNARIAERGRFIAPEFLPLGPPDPWEPAHSLLWGKTMGLWLSANWRTELSRLALSGRVPDAVIDQLWPPKGGLSGPMATHIPDPASARSAATLLAELPWFPAPHTMPPAASNEWAVDGRHTASGAPLLAGDPHLNFGFPGIWYLARIELPDRAMAGATGPGVPGIVIGHNGHIAWTFTTTGADVQDVFIETELDADHYETPTGPAPFLKREERIRVRGQPDEILIVRETRHGPVISDVQPTPSGAVLAVSMGHLRPGDTAAAGLMALNRARTVHEARSAAHLISQPVQNLLVADKTTIGLFVTGRIPIRKAGDGSRPVPGADGVYDWIDWAPPEAMPAVIGPTTGRLVNANDRIAPPDFPLFLGRDWLGDWRARRIRALLDQQTIFTPADFARMQIDAVSVFAREQLPTLLAVTLPPEHAAIRDILLDWDGAMAMDLPQPLLFNAWIAAFYHASLRALNVPAQYGGPIADFVAHRLRTAASDRDDLLRAAFAEALSTLTARFGADPTRWCWGDAHLATFAHPILRNIPVLGALTTIAIPSPGDDTTVNHGAMDASMRNVHGPGFRGVFDLADLDRSLFMATPGQTGNPLSPLSRHFATRWRDGDMITIAALSGQARARIRMTP